MSKKAIIFHGTGCKPSDFWYPWLTDQLQARGYHVDVPYYPRINREPITELLPKVLRSHQFDDQTLLIGHSAGGPLILSILQSIETRIPQAILVAGFSHELPGDERNLVLQESYNWVKISQHVKDITFINSVDDPWGCDDKQGREMFDQLGGTLIIRREGHFGSNALKQPYKTFPLLDHLIA